MKIAVGIPVFQNYPGPEVANDYMRMWYHFGRRMQEHEFFFIPKAKTEQFRARNHIVEAALRLGCDYLLFLDDDHIFDWREIPKPDSYDFLETLLGHMANNEKMGVVGCLYYHRTGKYRPVLMKRMEREGYHYTFMNDSEITGGLQRVDVQGGGVMLIRMSIFDKITPPYFEPEMQSEGMNHGTDIQLCRKAVDVGYEVWCDTSIVVGHVKQEREVVHPGNREFFVADNAMRHGIAEEWMIGSWLKGYRDDVKEYTGLDDEEIFARGIRDYGEKMEDAFDQYKNKDDYYRSLGVEQLCRQCYYHSRPDVSQEGLTIINSFRRGFKGAGLDFGCGSAPVGYELLKAGHKMDFVDLDGAGAYEFLKWRVGRSDQVIRDRVGWKLRGPYDFALLLDSIEHFEHWESILDDVIGRLKEKGVLVTNFFGNHDYNNPEHVNMDHGAVAEFLASRNMVPKSNMFWIKDDNFMGGAMRAHNIESAA